MNNWGPRTQRMIDSAPGYYQQSKMYGQIQQGIALDLESLDLSNREIKSQIRVRTATWGLKYWEETLGIIVVEADSFEVRRSRILGQLRGIGNLSAELVHSIAQAFTSDIVNVSIDLATGEILVEFIEDFPNTNDFKYQLEEIIHAHLRFKYISRMKEETQITAVQNVDDFLINMGVNSTPWGFIGGVAKPLTLNGIHVLNGDANLDTGFLRQGARHIISDLMRINWKERVGRMPTYNGLYLYDGNLLYTGELLTDKRQLADQVVTQQHTLRTKHGYVTSSSQLLQTLISNRDLMKTDHKHANRLTVDTAHAYTWNLAYGVRDTHFVKHAADILQAHSHSLQALVSVAYPVSWVNKELQRVALETSHKNDTGHSHSVRDTHKITHWVDKADSYTIQANVNASTSGSFKNEKQETQLQQSFSVPFQSYQADAVYKGAHTFNGSLRYDGEKPALENPIRHTINEKLTIKFPTAFQPVQNVGTVIQLPAHTGSRYLDGITYLDGKEIITGFLRNAGSIEVFKSDMLAESEAV